MGAVAIGVGAVVAATTAIAGSFGDSVSGIAVLLAAGAALIVNGALRLPRWARLRGRQMDALAAQMTSPQLKGTDDSARE
jgi:hypothetical protein